MGATVLLVGLCIVVALIGAWETARCRHHLTTNHKRRKTDIC
jgi:hypothetical protein